MAQTAAIFLLLLLRNNFHIVYSDTNTNTATEQRGKKYFPSFFEINKRIEPNVLTLGQQQNEVHTKISEHKHVQSIQVFLAAFNVIKSTWVLFSLPAVFSGCW